MCAELGVKGVGDGTEAVPLITGVVPSRVTLAGCSPNRRRVAFNVASRVPADSRGGSDTVESVDSESVRELELVSEAEEVESEADVATGCGTMVEMSRSAG